MPDHQRASSSHLAEDVLREQLLEIDGGLDLADTSIGGNDLLRAARADADVPLTDQPLGLDRGDRILLDLHAPVEAEHHPRLIVHEADRLDTADRHPGNLHARAGLEPPDCGKVDRDQIPRAPEERNPSESNRKVSQCQDPDDQKEPTATLTFVRSILSSFRTWGAPIWPPIPPNARSTPA